jgi:hypothetical protein
MTPVLILYDHDSNFMYVEVMKNHNGSTLEPGAGGPSRKWSKSGRDWSRWEWYWLCLLVGGYDAGEDAGKLV